MADVLELVAHREERQAAGLGGIAAQLDSGRPQQEGAPAAGLDAHVVDPGFGGRGFLVATVEGLLPAGAADLLRLGGLQEELANGQGELERRAGALLLGLALVAGLAERLKIRGRAGLGLRTSETVHADSKIHA